MINKTVKSFKQKKFLPKSLQNNLNNAFFYTNSDVKTTANKVPTDIQYKAPSPFNLL